MYALIVGHFLRMYDYKAAQKVDVFVANSKEVAKRIRKFYRREAVVIYPPVEMSKVEAKKGDYYLMISRLVGGKGIELAIEAAKKAGFKLKIAGEIAGYGGMKGVETLGRVSEEEKAKLMAGAKGFLALSKDEDFGITPVEAMMVGTPVIAFNGGGYKESVINKKTGILFDDYSVEGLIRAIREFGEIRWNREIIKKHAKQFSKEIFIKKMRDLCRNYLK